MATMLQEKTAKPCLVPLSAPLKRWNKSLIMADTPITIMRL
jgi:hypothetical protein